MEKNYANTDTMPEEMLEALIMLALELYKNLKYYRVYTVALYHASHYSPFFNVSNISYVLLHKSIEPVVKLSHFKQLNVCIASGI